MPSLQTASRSQWFRTLVELTCVKPLSHTFVSLPELMTLLVIIRTNRAICLDHSTIHTEQGISYSRAFHNLPILDHCEMHSFHFFSEGHRLVFAQTVKTLGLE